MANNILRLSDLFAWGNDLNYKRGWDLIPISMAFVHFSEELGELAEVVVSFKTESSDEREARIEVAGEAADAMILLIKLAQICNVDLLTALRNKGYVEFSSDIPSAQHNFTEYVELLTMRMLKSLGELARHVNFEEKFKNPKKRTGTQRTLLEELVWMFAMLVEMFTVCQVDVTEILRTKMEKIAKRFEPEMALMETLSYLHHAADVSATSLGRYKERFH